MTSAEWKGAYVPYDILKEAFVAFLAVAVLIVLLAVVFSSPDEPAITLKTWSIANPVDFAQTAVTELDGTSAVATYGPPYNATPDSSQHIGFFEPAQWLGVHQPIDTAQDFVIGPLRTLPNQPLVQARSTCTRVRRQRSRARGRRRTRRLLPMRPMSMDDCTSLRALWPGRRDHRLTDRHGADRGPRRHAVERGSVLQHELHQATALHCRRHVPGHAGRRPTPSGSQWGMMNETGNYPGPGVALALHDVVPGAAMNTSSNGDLEVWAIMMALTIGLIFLPFIPILRSIPRWSRGLQGDLASALPLLGVSARSGTLYQVPPAAAREGRGCRGHPVWPDKVFDNVCDLGITRW